MLNLWLPCAWSTCKLSVFHSHACVFSHVRLFVTPWIVAHQAPLSMRFPRQEDWLRLPFSSLQISHIQEIPFMSEQNRNHCKLYQTPAL